MGNESGVRHRRESLWHHHFRRLARLQPQRQRLLRPWCCLQAITERGRNWTEQVLHSFTAGKDGASPTCKLVFDAAGNLYGTTYWGGYNGNGNVFELRPKADGTWTEQVLHQFTGGLGGGVPFAGVTFDASGNLYGTTTAGGFSGYGVVFKMTPKSTGGWSYRVLHRFIDTPGAYPYGGVIFDAAGNLYGTTEGDNSKTFGSVFEITP